jgi:hypothetical protein
VSKEMDFRQSATPPMRHTPPRLGTPNRILVTPEVLLKMFTSQLAVFTTCGVRASQ